MSLGGNSSGVKDLLAMGVDNLDVANMVIAVAAGNRGPGFSTVESPGKAARALTAGASTVGHFIATPVTTADGADLSEPPPVTSTRSPPRGQRRWASRRAGPRSTASATPAQHCRQAA